MMDQTTAWVIALVITIIAFGAYLRWRYGNLYLRVSAAVERTTGVKMVAVVRALGILTVVVWAAVYVMSRSDPDTGFEELLGWPAGRPEGAAEGP